MMAFNTSSEEMVQHAVHPQRVQDVIPTAAVEEFTSKETTVSALEKKTRGYLKTFQRSFSSSAIERNATATEDPSVMTINFLRMRLQSQRADYRAEKQKAQQLAQKVLELEQRLSVEVELRKKAELGHVYSFPMYETLTSRHHGSVPYNSKINYHDINSGEQQESPHGCRSCFSSCNGCQHKKSILQHGYPCQSLSNSCEPYRYDGLSSKPFSPLESPRTRQSSRFSSDADYCKEQRIEISPQQEIRFKQILSPIRKNPDWLALPVDYREASNTKSEQHNPRKHHLISMEYMEEPSRQEYQSETSRLISKAEQSPELLVNRKGCKLDLEESEMSEPHPNLKQQRDVKGKQIMQDWSTGKNTVGGLNTCLLPHWKSNNFTGDPGSMSSITNLWKEEISMDNPCNCLKNQVIPQQFWRQREARSKSEHDSIHAVDGKAIGQDQAHELYRDFKGHLHSKKCQGQDQGTLLVKLGHSSYCTNHRHLKRASSDKFLPSSIQCIDNDYDSHTLHYACSRSNGESIHNGIGIATNPSQSLGQAYEAGEAKYQGPMYMPVAERNRSPSSSAAPLAKRAEPKHPSYHRPATAGKDGISSPIGGGRRSLDGGLDEVKDILKALKVAKQQVEAADEMISIS